MYKVGRELDLSREEIDLQHRSLEDYALAELEYEESKTCCWNSSNAEMFDAIMKYNACLTGQADDAECAFVPGFVAGECHEPLTFKARDDGTDGYKAFADFAERFGKTGWKIKR